MKDDVLVVGAGVIGLSIAEALAQEGLRVRVLDQEGVAAGASGAAAGMLAPVSEVVSHAVGEVDPALLRLGTESLSRFPALCDRLREEAGIDPEFEASGSLRPVASEAERARLAERYARATGRVEWLDRGEEPGLLSSLSPGFQGAFFIDFECHVRPPRLVEALAESLRRRGGAIEAGVSVQRLVWSGRRCVGVETAAGRRSAGHVVVAAGPWTPALLGPAADALDARAASGRPVIEPVRGQILALGAPLPPATPILYGPDVYCVPKRDGSWVVGATEERVGFDRRVTGEGVAELLARAAALVPALGAATFLRAWAGLRPVAADGQPRVGAIPDATGLHVAAGHGRNGVLLAPLTAERVRDELLGKRPIGPVGLWHGA